MRALLICLVLFVAAALLGVLVYTFHRRIRARWIRITVAIIGACVALLGSARSLIGGHIYLALLGTKSADKALCYGERI